MWGAANGGAQLPADELRRLEQWERVSIIASELHARAINAVTVGHVSSTTAVEGELVG